MDACASCQGSHDVDLSKSSFAKLADTDVGTLQGSWEFVDPKDDIAPVRRRSVNHRLSKSRRRLDDVDSAEVTPKVTEINAEHEEVGTLGK
jgi:hypothetical protein